ncbi:MAG: DedA family protein [Woronichinia naegeliana WA131]|jgi:membrane protein DedA with SNARE-associated domain|uniref:DedA family protein n=1 Tax=Woronichinia naegeliana WA131 TaxID=2824559 RepID=A0A977KTZ8_9CYAN|nr:MAG: DedA family protein [Woronichinia naegeliana WA131]
MSQWLAEWIPALMNQLGYLGIALLMFLENLFPPIPSELIMPLAGFTAAQGKMELIPAILAGVVGTILGAFPWYYLGRVMSEERLEYLADNYGKWIGLSSQDIRKANRWFTRHGGKAVFFCRLVPGVRTLISLPAGINGMPLLPFTLYSTIGTTLWVGLLAIAGYKLGDHYELVEKYLDPVSKIVLVSLVIFLILWIFRKRLRRAN